MADPTPKTDTAERTLKSEERTARDLGYHTIHEQFPDLVIQCDPIPPKVTSK